MTIDESLAIVGTRTAVFTDSDVSLRRALDRAERDAGVPAERLHVDGGEDQQLFEVTAPPGLGPDRMVFGLIGDAFVVAPDEEMARRAAGLETGSLDEDAAGAVRDDQRRARGDGRYGPGRASGLTSTGSPSAVSRPPWRRSQIMSQ